MKKIFIVYFFILTIVSPTFSFSEEWHEIGDLKVQDINIKIYGDKSSIRIDNALNEYRKMWVKFNMSKSMKSEFNDKDYKTRKEEYFFNCDNKTFTVSHTILLSDDEKIVFDSGYFNPFTKDYEKQWHTVDPDSAPYLIFSKICRTESTQVKTAKDTQKEKKEENNDNGFKSSGTFSGGEITDGLDLKVVRWAPRDDFERLVFDVYRWGGPEKPEGTEPVEVPGYFEVSKVKDKNELKVKLGGYRAFTADIPGLEDSKFIKNINLDKTEENADDSGYTFYIELKEPAKFNAFELHKPGRIVIDLKDIE